MDKQLLEVRVQRGWTVRQIANSVGSTSAGVRHWMEKYGIKTLRSPSVRPKHQCRCGETDPKKFYGHKTSICAECHNDDVVDRNRRMKRRIVEYLGGCCIACGYDRSDGSLDVHHLDSSEKDPNFKSKGGWSWARMQRELLNCVLVCKNCHQEIHDGLLRLYLFPRPQECYIEGKRGSLI